MIEVILITQTGLLPFKHNQKVVALGRYSAFFGQFGFTSPPRQLKTCDRFNLAWILFKSKKHISYLGVCGICTLANLGATKSDCKMFGYEDEKLETRAANI